MGWLPQLGGILWNPQKPKNQTATTLPQTSHHQTRHQQASLPIHSKLWHPSIPHLVYQGKQTLLPVLKRESEAGQEAGRGRQENEKYHTYSATFLPLKNQSLFKFIPFLKSQSLSKIRFFLYSINTQLYKNTMLHKSKTCLPSTSSFPFYKGHFTKIQIFPQLQNYL